MNSEIVTPQIAEPVFRKRKWPYPMIWLVPILTAVGAGLYLKDYLLTHGTEITIEFSDASGMMEKETKIKYRGAEVGRVTEIKLADDHKHALVTAELDKREDVFATKGAVYWVVRPEVSDSGLQGLGTILTGPYISAIPGSESEEKIKFEGLSKPPRPYEDGERFVLSMVSLGHVQDGAAVYYKGIQVGTVQEIELAKEADHVDVHIVVWSRYAALVRENSKFWVASGFDFKGGIFSGVELKLDSLKAVMSGGINFANPEKDMAGPAKSGARFAIDDNPKKEWENWSPHVRVHPRDADSLLTPTQLPTVKHEKK